MSCFAIRSKESSQRDAVVELVASVEGAVLSENQMQEKEEKKRSCDVNPTFENSWLMNRGVSPFIGWIQTTFGGNPPLNHGTGQHESWVNIRLLGAGTPFFLPRKLV